MASKVNILYFKFPRLPSDSVSDTGGDGGAPGGADMGGRGGGGSSYNTSIMSSSSTAKIVCVGVAVSRKPSLLRLLFLEGGLTFLLGRFFVACESLSGCHSSVVAEGGGAGELLGELELYMPRPPFSRRIFWSSNIFSDVLLFGGGVVSSLSSIVGGGGLAGRGGGVSSLSDMLLLGRLGYSVFQNTQTVSSNDDLSHLSIAKR